MSSITAIVGRDREMAIDKFWRYLNANFDNFNEEKKIKIAVALCAKSMPTIVEGNYNVTKMQTVKIDDKEQELNFGRTSGLTSSSN